MTRYAVYQPTKGNLLPFYNISTLSKLFKNFSKNLFITKIFQNHWSRLKKKENLLVKANIWRWKFSGISRNNLSLIWYSMGFVLSFAIRLYLIPTKLIKLLSPLSGLSLVDNIIIHLVTSEKLNLPEMMYAWSEIL